MAGMQVHGYFIGIDEYLSFYFFILGVFYYRIMYYYDL